MIKLGSHISFKSPGYLVDSVKESMNNNANTMMIYLGAPQNTKRVSVEKFNLEEYEARFQNFIPKEDIIVHAPYIINPASLEKSSFAKEFLIEEIKRMNYLGLKYLVLHPGAYTIYSEQEALDELVQTLTYVIENTSDVVICIETMSGKGTEIGTNFEQLKFLIDFVNSERLKICLDTCHMWDSGYDLQSYDEFKEELIRWDILKHVKVIHLNDSKNEVFSHKDRHANIGRGTIGLETLRKFVHDPDFDNIPIILETPVPEDGPIYDQEIEMLIRK
ncbi:deoxyribonuclease IV [Mycoplasma sp. CSL10137]|uniref:deoxyribonuclease IV n=1 Tax=unclassified Mycoplasma TaxID=2683645 RepID=UPI00197B8839|nr:MULTISPECIES: deoxyribonuclease IV [unclassified Mycoplasma]MBN4083456.1 deoxyribonuclease IV [Mycoplasma sp. CSL10137]MBN4084613.1 deoxyribonuclease IV [Mycoplasma sp. CSL10166]MBU4693091.1 deoxyribonuclease IV [Mycoplasma sp. CSL7491-lung]